MQNFDHGTMLTKSATDLNTGQLTCESKVANNCLVPSPPRPFSMVFSGGGSIDPLNKWRLNLNNRTYTSLASHSCQNPLS